MPSYVSLHKSLNNPPVHQQSIIDEPYEYNYLLPVINTASTITSVQNANVANGGNVLVNFTDSTNNVIQIAYSAGTARIHGYIEVLLYDDGTPIDVPVFLINESTGSITLFKTEEIDRVIVVNLTGVTLSLGLFVGIGTQKTPPNHPYV